LEAEIINSYFKGKQMKHYFRPTGNMLKLMDGRVFKKNQKNLWEDINSGVTINESQLQNFISSAAFTADPGGAPSGGKKKLTPIPEEEPNAVVSLSAPFDDIVLNTNDTVFFNANRTLSITGGPVTLRITFSSVGEYNNSTFSAFKNDAQVNRITVSAGSAGLVTTLTGTFADGDQLKFACFISSLVNLNFDVTIEKTAPGLTSVLDDFTVRTAFD